MKSLIVVLLVALLAIVLSAQAQQYVKVQAPTSLTPLTIVIVPEVPDGAQVCAATREWVTCRTAGEFRKWVSSK